MEVFYVYTQLYERILKFRCKMVRGQDQKQKQITEKEMRVAL